MDLRAIILNNKTSPKSLTSPRRKAVFDKNEDKKDNPNNTAYLSRTLHYKSKLEKVDIIIQECNAAIQENNLDGGMQKLEQLDQFGFENKNHSIYMDCDYIDTLNDLRKNLATKIWKANKESFSLSNTVLIAQLDYAKSILKKISRPSPMTFILILKINELTLQYFQFKKDSPNIQKYKQICDKDYREKAENALKRSRLNIGCQKLAQKFFKKAEEYLEKIHDKTPEDITKIHECELAQAKYSHACYASMFQIIGGGSVPEADRARIVALPIAECKK